MPELTKELSPSQKSKKQSSKQPLRRMEKLLNKGRWPRWFKLAWDDAKAEIKADFKFLIILSDVVLDLLTFRAFDFTGTREINPVAGTNKQTAPGREG